MPIISENVRRSIKDTYRDFAGNTSVHGTQNTIDGTKFTRFIWTTIVLSALGVSVYMLLLIWWRFTSAPTITYVESAYGSTYQLPFPAVTICNNNKVIPSKVEDFVDSMNLFERKREDVVEAIPQILSLAAPAYHSMNTSSVHWLSDLLKQNGYDEFQAYLEITQSCEELILRCKWEGIEFSCEDRFTETITTSGRCCTFNMYLWENLEPDHTRYFGPHMGLLVVTNNTDEVSKYNLLYFAGITVIIHNSLEFPSPTHIHRTMSNGKILFLQIFGSILEDTKEVRALPYNQRDCIYSNQSNDDYFPQYSDENCNTACQIRLYENNCKCVPYLYNFLDIPLCDFKKLNCLQEIANITKNECNCPSQCESIMYSLLSSGSTLVNEKTAISSFLKDLDTSSSSLINVFFPRQTYTHIKRGLVTDDLYILSSLGGIFGLLLGCSFTSVAEMLYEILIRFLINLKILNRVRTAEKIKWRNNPRDIYYDEKVFYN